MKVAPGAAASQEMKETGSYTHAGDALAMQLSTSLLDLAD